MSASSNLIGLTGSHGSGKTTILAVLRGRGIQTEARSLSRTAQAKLGWNNVHQAEESVLNMWTLQYEILNAMEQRDLSIIDGNRKVIVDRTPADVIAYTKLWVDRIGIEKIDMDQLAEYERSCIRLGELYHHQLFVPIREEINFVSESGRADRASQEFHSRTVEGFLIENAFDYSTIQTLSPEDRADEAQRWL